MLQQCGRGCAGRLLPERVGLVRGGTLDPPALLPALAPSRCSPSPAPPRSHGANDGSVPVSFTDKWVEALKEQGKQEVRYTRYEWACAAGVSDRAWVVSAQYTDAALLAPPLRRPPPPMPEYSQMTGHASYEYAYREPELWSWLLQQRCAACAGPPRHAGTSSAEHVGSVSKLNQLNAALGT
jgi:hypothetical protein